jgi:vacuolar-type H+-ATPase subunit E/Vma4
MSTEIELLQARTELLEEVVNSVQIALTNVASTEAVSQIILLVQTDIQDLQTDLAALTTRVNLIYNEVFS